MFHCTLIIAVMATITYNCGDCLELVCQIHLQLDISATLAEELRHCTVYIVHSASFDINKSTVLSDEELYLLDVLKRSNSSADVLLTIALPFNVTMLSTQAKLAERIAIVLRDNSLDGVDLDLDASEFDRFEKTRYAQFLRRLRALLRDKYKISTKVGCAPLGNPNILPKAFNDQLDMLTVVGVDGVGGSVSNGSDEFIVRQYLFEPVKRLIKDGISARKIVLSLVTVGVVFNPASYRITRSLQQSHVGVLGYDQVCELMLELEAKCGASGFRKRPGCSIFNGKGVVVYDDNSSAETRAKQALGIGVKGVLVLPNYDDAENLCDKGPFPLFRSLRTTVATRRAYFPEDDLVCSEGYRYGGFEEGKLYYKCYDERFEENYCEPGTVFNDHLKICIARNVPPLVLRENTHLVDYTETPTSKQPVVTTTSGIPATAFPNKTKQRPVPTEETLEYLLATMQDTLSYLCGIIERALDLVVRLQYLGHILVNDTDITVESIRGVSHDYVKEDVPKEESETLLVPVISEDHFATLHKKGLKMSSSEETKVSTPSLLWPFPLDDHRSIRRK